MDNLEMVGIQQNGELIEKKGIRTTSGYPGQETTGLPRFQVYMGEDEARMLCLEVSLKTHRRSQKDKGRGWFSYLSALLVYPSLSDI